MDEGRYLVDELCRRTGFPRRTVRYYVQEGLIDPPAGRGRGGFYGDHHVAQLARIRELQDEGFRLDAIRGLLGRAVPVEAAGAADAEAGSPRPPVAATSWTRHAIAPGIELHVSAEAGVRLGPAIEAALVAVRSIIDREGGPNG